MKLSTVFRYDQSLRLFRLCRVIRTVGRVGDGNGYSSKVSLGLVPRLFGCRRELHAFVVTILGLRFHYVRSYGGIFA